MKVSRFARRSDVAIPAAIPAAERHVVAGAGFDDIHGPAIAACCVDDVVGSALCLCTLGGVRLLAFGRLRFVDLVLVSFLTNFRSNFSHFHSPIRMAPPKEP